jgi:hypothetical protein
VGPFSDVWGMRAECAFTAVQKTMIRLPRRGFKKRNCPGFPN